MAAPSTRNIVPLLPIGVAAPTRSVAGIQPAASGVLGRKLQALRTVAGIQPAASGTLVRKLQAKRTLAGVQPSASGVLIRKLQAKRTLAGIQPAASGVLTAVASAVPPVSTPPSAIAPFAVPWYPMRRRKVLKGAAAFSLTFRMVAQGEVEYLASSAITISLSLVASGQREVLAAVAFTSSMDMKAWGKAVRTRRQREEQEEYELLGI